MKKETSPTAVDRERILLDVVLGRPKPANESARAAEVRRRYQKDIDEMRRLGLVIDMPGHNP